MILGRIGVNFVVAHRRSIFRCAPEQLRFATSEEREVATFDAAELLGIKTLLEKGQFPTSQFADLVHQEGPPIPENVLESIQEQAEGARSAAQIYEDQAEEPQVKPETASKPNVATEPAEAPATVPDESAPSSSYGPVRRKKPLAQVS